MDWLSHRLGHPSLYATGTPSDKGGDSDLTQKERPKANTPDQTVATEYVRRVAIETLELRKIATGKDVLDYEIQAVEMQPKRFISDDCRVIIMIQDISASVK